MQKIFAILWPSFIVAGIAEGLFFTVIDPQELYFFGQEVHFSKIGMYSIGFFLFWLTCAASSLMTVLLQLTASEVNRNGEILPTSGNPPN